MPTIDKNNTKSIREQITELEKLEIEDALLKHKFNKSKTAEYLKIDRKTLYNRMHSLGMM